MGIDQARLYRAARVSRRGSALLTVLWLTAALAAIGVAVAHNVRGETERAATNVDDVRAVFLAKAAIHRAILYRQWGPDFYKPGMPGFDFNFPGGAVHVDMVPESARMSLNSATPEELFRLLRALGEPEDRATETAAAIVDWRTPVSPERPGLFEGFYLTRVPSFLPAHTSFRETEELLLVRGVTSDLYYGTSLDGSRAGLRDCLSASSAGGSLDANFARRETMIAAGINPQDADVIVRMRTERPFVDYRQLEPVMQALGPVGGRLTLGSGSMLTFRATARVRTQDGKLSDLRRTLAALVKIWMPGNRLGKQPGMEVVRWYDRV